VHRARDTVDDLLLVGDVDTVREIHHFDECTFPLQTCDARGADPTCAAGHDRTGTVEIHSVSFARVWFGLYLPQLRMSFDRILERTLAAEAAGFDSVWLMDHFGAPLAPDVDTFEGWTVASALAARTSTIRIGHLVLCDPFRHPALLAKMAATLDVISDGRVELGIGWGSVPDELRTFGFGADPARVRAARLRESLEILALMFAGEPFDYDGAYYTLRGAQGRPVPRQPKVPVHIGGGGPKLTMPLVRDFADWWNCPGYALTRLDELRALAGDARISAQHPIGLAATDAEREQTAEQVQRRFGSWGGVITGTAPEVANAIARDIDEGVEGFVCQFSDFGTVETIERFMGDVVPRLTT
jgi:alkanesulfonate monooxygenase SsuD/methylene tetrahydromethanopterin reductase-like flavin-dependent oxidoreductase (luciferase family)